MKQSHFSALTLILSLAGAVPAMAATPTIGQPAPALTFTQLLNAPEGAKADWPSLKGKVVVLEFWATWCAPCIAEIPHLNEIAQSVAANNVQFIAVDDEDPAVVEEFLGKKPMAAWAGVDTSKKIFEDFGVQDRPTTIVIDTQGRVAALLRPEALKKEQLVSLASGAPTVFPTDPKSALREEAVKEARAEAKKPSGDGLAKPLFEVSIRPGDATKMPSMSFNSSTAGGGISYNIMNTSVAMLMEFALGTPGDRLVIHGGDKDARYNMRLVSPESDTKLLAPIVEEAIAQATGMKLSHSVTKQDAYVLQATSQGSSKLMPTASKFESMCDFDVEEGKLKMVKTSFDDLASRLEGVFDIPVVDETGIKGEFDAEFTLPKDSFEGSKAALEANLGVTLVKTRRTIDKVQFDALPTPAKAEAAADAKGALTPGQPVQRMAVPRQ